MSHRLRVLVACEFSGRVRDAFPHIQDDVLKHLEDGWDLMIAHPPCTYLCGAGARWWKYRQQEQQEALEFVRRLLTAPIHGIALENPYGRISTAIRKPDQIVQPYWFGDEAQKTTHLWLKNLPKLQPTNVVSRGTIYTPPDGKQPGAAWLLMLPPSPDRWKKRSRTFQGIANAMAEQWGGPVSYEAQSLAQFG